VLAFARMGSGRVALAIRVVVVSFVAAGVGCRRVGDEELGLRSAEETRVSLDRLTEPEQLLRALDQAGSTLEARLGPRGLDLSHTVELSAGDGALERTDKIEQTFRFDTDGHGAFRLLRELGHPHALAPAPGRTDDETAPKTWVDQSAQGMEAIALAGHLYVRGRFGRFIDRRPEPGELDRLRALCEGVLHDDLALLAPFLTIDDRGQGRVNGRRTRRLALGKRDRGRTAARDEDPRRAWRASIEVESLTGEVELDEETGAPLRASLDARYRVPQKTPPLRVHLALRQEPRSASTIEAPADAVPAPRRPRPTVERNQLLEGLAAPVGTQGSRQ
jgi:hypothetical protein